MDLRVANVRRMRFVWQAHQLLRGQKARGFQYCQAFLDRLGKKAVEECHRLDLQEVVSHYQLLPARYLLEHSIGTNYYIDTTLQDLFETHRMFTWMNVRIAEEAVERERAEYHAASRIVTMACWVRETLQRSYGLSVDRIQTVLPGANLPEDAVLRRLGDRGPSASPDGFTLGRPLRLGFTGKDWKRKGLPRLVAAVELLNRSGVPAEVVVIGNLPRQYRNHRSVRAAGFIDKSRELPRFMDILDSCDLGCVPSYEEPMGIAPMEYLRLGVPILCTAAGGLIDVCKAAGPASILLNKDATAEEIAAVLERLARNPGTLQRMRVVAWERKEFFSWDRTIQELQRLWAT
jgi:glycosyltransferase involved in cell wall biosynthesis